jgi:hypothetical protein
MSNINRNQILVSLLILFVIGLSSCQEEEIVEVEKGSEPKATYVTPAKDLNLASQITKLNKRKIKNGRYTGILDKLETAEVLKVETDSSVSYSFNVNEANYYANLIVWEYKGETLTFIQGFEPNERFLEYLARTDATDFTNFSGKLVIRDLEGQLISTTTLKCL